jgi:hypothetical protein
MVVLWLVSLVVLWKAAAKYSVLRRRHWMRTVILYSSTPYRMKYSCRSVHLENVRTLLSSIMWCDDLRSIIWVTAQKAHLIINSNTLDSVSDNGNTRRRGSCSNFVDVGILSLISIIYNTPFPGRETQWSIIPTNAPVDIATRESRNRAFLSSSRFISIVLAHNL